MRSYRKIIPSHLPFAEQQRLLKERESAQTFERLDAFYRFFHEADERYRDVNMVPEDRRFMSDD